MSDPSTADPYRIQTPAADPLAPVEGDYFRYRRFLIVPRETELPHRCILTGEETGPEDWRKRKRFAFMPPTLALGILASFLLPPGTEALRLIVLFLALLLAIVLRRRVVITYSLGRRARRKLQNRIIAATACLLGSITLFLVAFSTSDRGVTDKLFILGLLLLVIGLVLFSFVNPLRAIRHRKGWFQIKGASPAFLDTLPEADWRTL